jgi:hypothetical protein
VALAGVLAGSIHNVFPIFFAKNGQKQLSLEEVRDMLDVDDDEDLDSDDYGHESDFESESD